jgi:integrase
MPVRKCKKDSTWYYQFDLPGSSRQNRKRASGGGFSTKQEAIDAEVDRRVEERQKRAMAKAGASVVAEVPTTLGKLLDEFLAQHVDKKLAPKTAERYHEQSGYIDAALRDMPIGEITPLHLNREWNRLLEGGGHHRYTKAPRALSKKTVRNIAGVLSSAFTRAIRWGLLKINPVTNSEPPVPKKCKGAAISVSDTDMLIEAASGPWCLSMLLDLTAALGSRRGEVMALRWSDILHGRAYIGRSLSQTKKLGLIFKPVKGHENTEGLRVVAIPEDTLVKLEAHRQRQDKFRRQYGPDYRADLDLIFANPDGTPLKPDSISASVSTLFKRLKIRKPKGAALHLLRHTLASQMLDDGVPLPVVSQRLGHSSIRTTAEIYAHAIHGQDDEATRRLQEYRQRNRPPRPENWKGGVQ